MMSVNREKVGVTLLTIAITSSILIFYNNWVYAQANQTATSVAASSSKFIGAGMAFGLAAAGSGIGCRYGRIHCNLWYCNDVHNLGSVIKERQL